MLELVFTPLGRVQLVLSPEQARKGSGSAAKSARGRKL